MAKIIITKEASMLGVNAVIQTDDYFKLFNSPDFAYNSAIKMKLPGFWRVKWKQSNG